MPRANLTSLLRLPSPGAWAVGCFAVHNLEFIRAVVAAAEAEAAPVILSLDAEEASRRGLESLAAAALQAAAQAAVPVTVHLNHARHFDALLTALDAGVDSLMFDGSALPLAENIALTQKAAHMAHEAGAAIEGEAGPLAGPEDLEKALLLARETGVDCLAVSFSSGKAESAASFIEKLVRDQAPPLALHGGSTLGRGGLIQAVRAGVRKVNAHSEPSRIFAQAVGRALTPGSPCCLAALDCGVEALTIWARGKLRQLGSSGRVVAG